MSFYVGSSFKKCLQPRTRFVPRRKYAKEDFEALLEEEAKKKGPAPSRRMKGTMRLRAFTRENKFSREWNRNWKLGGTVMAEIVGPKKDKLWMWHFDTEGDAEYTIEGLETFGELCRVRAGKKQQQRGPQMIILENNIQMATVEDTLQYLEQVLPLSAQLLEAYPYIAGPESYGRTNAHGNPLDTHVAGICHFFPQHKVPELAQILDVYQPTRLALGPPNLRSARGDCEPAQWEAVVENTDCIVATHKSKEHLQPLQQIWAAQERDQCTNTYCAILKSTKKVKSAKRGKSPAMTALALQQVFKECKKRDWTLSDDEAQKLKR